MSSTRPSCPNENTLNENFVEAPDLVGCSAIDDKVSALVPIEDILLVIIFEDTHNASIIFDMNVFASKKVATSLKSTVIPLGEYKKIFGNPKDVRYRNQVENVGKENPVEGADNGRAVDDVGKENPVEGAGNEIAVDDVEEENPNEGAGNESMVEQAVINSGQSQQLSQPPNEDLFKRPESSTSRADSTDVAEATDEPYNTVEADLSSNVLRFSAGNLMKSFDIVTHPDRDLVEQFLGKEAPKWVPANPYSDPLKCTKEEIKKKKSEGHKLRTEFWNRHFPAPFNMFHLMSLNQEMPYYFVPIDQILTPKQKNMMNRDWTSIAGDGHPGRQIYVLFDRSLTVTSHYTGILQILIKYQLKN